MSTSNNDIMLQLRSQTAAAHQQLESTSLSKSMMSNTLTVDEYITYLQRMYSVVKPFEDQVYVMLTNCLPDVEQRRKAALIEKDLQVLNAAIPKQLASLHINNIDEAFGAMYVVEGSTLGGKFLYANVNKQLGFNEHSGAAYFYGYGNNTGKMWQQFAAALTCYAAGAGHAHTIVNSATQTFTTFYEQLSRS